MAVTTAEEAKVEEAKEVAARAVEETAEEMRGPLCTRSSRKMTALV